MKKIISKKFLFTLTIIMIVMFFLISLKESTANKETPKRATLVYFNIIVDDING